MKFATKHAVQFSLLAMFALSSTTVLANPAFEGTYSGKLKQSDGQTFDGSFTFGAPRGQSISYTTGSGSSGTGTISGNTIMIQGRVNWTIRISGNRAQVSGQSTTSSSTTSGTFVKQ